MTQLSLSDDLIEITAEINIWKQQAGQAVFEIGKRLKHVKENDLVHGQWESWLLSIDIAPRTARAFIQAYEQFGNRQTSTVLPTGKIFEMLSLPESVDRQEFLDKPHTIPSTNEVKTVDEMTVRELREVKQQLKQAENEKIHYQKLWQQAKEQPAKVVTQMVEVVPTDYNDLKKQASSLQQLNTENVQLKRTITEQRDHYESIIQQDQKKDAALKELRKNLADLLRNSAMFHESAMYYFGEVDGNREAHIAVTNFLTQYSELCTKQFAEWKSLTAIKAVN